MKCPHCNTELIWGGDHDCDEHDFVMVTNLSCPSCDAFVLVYLPEDLDSDDQDKQHSDS